MANIKNCIREYAATHYNNLVNYFKENHEGVEINIPKNEEDLAIDLLVELLFKTSVLWSPSGIRDICVHDDLVTSILDKAYDEVMDSPYPAYETFIQFMVSFHSGEWPHAFYWTPLYVAQSTFCFEHSYLEDEDWGAVTNLTRC